MLIKNVDLNPNLSQAQTDMLINSLLVSKLRWSEIACFGGYAYGVDTYCPDCEDCRSFFNKCLRNSVVPQLVAAQELAERLLNYDLTPRYISHTQRWDGTRRIQLKAGIEAINVTPTVTSLGVDYLVDITYPIIEDVTMVADSGGQCVASLDVTLFHNPNKAVFRKRTTNEIIPRAVSSEYPKRVGSDWAVALGAGISSPCETTVDVYHCDLVRVVAPEADVEGGYVAPVYPNTNQIIPQARDSELSDDGTERTYWFYVYTLLAQAFSDEGANLVAGEYYKLMPQIEFKHFSETSATIMVEYSEPSTENDGSMVYTEAEAAGFKVIDSQNGVIEVYEDLTANLEPLSCYPYRTITGVTVHYKTNPNMLDVHGNTLDIIDAIAHLAAAELPLAACNCEPRKEEKNFVTKAQESYTQAQIMYGTVIENFEHGKLYGQEVFNQKISRLPQLPKVTQL